MAISKVKNVQGNGDWESQYGKMYSFEYEFEDGVTLKANHKSPDGAFKIGDEVEYTVTKENEYGKLGKVSKPQEGGYSSGGNSYGGRSADRQTHIIRQTCIKAACELYSNTNTDASKCIAAAKMFEHYVTTGELPS